MSDAIVPERALSENISVPVEFHDVSAFDGAFTYMKQRFGEEMRRIEDEITNFSKNLQSLSGKAGYQADLKPGLDSKATWEAIASSPLVEGDGDEKTLRLQFDVSLFEPNEVIVNIVNGLLIVSAQHDIKTDTTSTFNAYHREFLLPSGTDPMTVESVLSKDGILTIRTPLRLATERRR